MFRATDPRFPELLKLAKRLRPVYEALTAYYPQLTFPVGVMVPEVDTLSEKMKKLEVGPKQPTGEARNSSSSSDDQSRNERSSRSSWRSQQKKKKKKKTKSKKKNRKESSTSSETDRSTSESESSDGSQPRRGGRHGGGSVNPVTRWEPRFSGSEDLDSFIEDVECTADMNSVSDVQLLRGVGSLLTGPARTWYRAEKKKGKLTSWRIFKKKMKAAFQPGNRDDQIMDKLQQLKQKHDETYAVYEARADELFRRLERRLHEKDKLRFLMGGLDIFYRQRVVSADMEQVRDLRRFCQAIEEDKVSIKKLEREEERRKERHMHQKSGFRVAATGVTDEDEDADRVSVAAAGPPKKSDGSGGKFCWRCGSRDHQAHDCPRGVRCSSCGQEGTTVEECIRCEGAGRKGLWGSASGSPSAPPQQPQVQQPTLQGVPQPPVQQLPPGMIAYPVFPQGNFMGPWYPGQPGPMMFQPQWSFPPPQMVGPQAVAPNPTVQGQGAPASQPPSRTPSQPRVRL